ncbi:hypothetical protein AAFC00_000004 [Neodothiora populina]
MLRLRSDSPQRGSAVTLMSTDVDRICTVLEQVNSLWAGTIEVVIAMVLLEREVGLAAVAPLCFGIAAALVTSFISAKSPRYQQAWFRAIEKRVSITSGVLGSIKGIKMMGLKPLVSSIVRDRRTNEINLSKGYRYINVVLNLLVNSQLVFFPVLVFEIFIATSVDHFTVSKAFTTLSITALLSGPLIEILTNMYLLASAATCFTRIQDFLVLSDLVDRRTDETSGTQQTRRYSDITNTAVAIRHAEISARADSSPTLRDLHIDVMFSNLTMIVGPTGSGKSALLRALLGEVYISAGTITIASKKVAYCNDQPWLTNDTIPANVVAGNHYDPEWFASVLDASGFDEELRALIRDGVSIGSMGLILSGGQRQRVSLTRAIYSKERIIVLDNPLSGLDAHTEARVMNGLFGHGGLLKNGSCAVILATNSNYLPLADKIIALGSDGRISYQGPLDDFAAQSNLTRIGSNEMLARPGANAPVPIAAPLDPLPPLRRSVPIVPGDVSRRTGDLSAYRYYLLALGYTQTFVFAISIALRVLCIQYPR